MEIFMVDIKYRLIHKNLSGYHLKQLVHMDRADLKQCTKWDLK